MTQAWFSLGRENRTDFVERLRAGRGSEQERSGWDGRKTEKGMEPGSIWKTKME